MIIKINDKFYRISSEQYLLMAIFGELGEEHYDSCYEDFCELSELGIDASREEGFLKKRSLRQIYSLPKKRKRNLKRLLETLHKLELLDETGRIKNLIDESDLRKRFGIDGLR